jgi:hypothetical protein
MELNPPDGDVPRGSTATAAAAVRSLRENGYRIGRRGIEALFRRAERNDGNNDLPLSTLLGIPNLRRDDLGRLKPLCLHNTAFASTLLRHRAANESFLERTLKTLPDEGTGLLLKAVIAEQAPVRESATLQAMLAESRSDRVLRTLLSTAGPDDGARLFRTLLDRRPAQAARLLTSVALPEGVQLTDDEIAVLLSSNDRKIRETVLVHLNPKTRSQSR